jgi:hypothetical protein
VLVRVRSRLHVVVVDAHLASQFVLLVAALVVLRLPQQLQRRFQPPWLLFVHPKLVAGLAEG